MAITKAEEYGKVFGRMCHFLALSKTIRINDVIDNLVATTFAFDAAFRPASPQSVSEAVTAYFGIALAEAEASDSISRLFERKELVLGPDGAYSLTSDSRARVAGVSEAAINLEAAVRTEWLDEVEQQFPGLSNSDKGQLWSALQTYMALAFHRHGAQTIQLLAPDVAIASQVNMSLSALIQKATAQTKGSLPFDTVDSSIRLFFRKQTACRTRYLAQLLDATFTFFALSADAATSEYLRGAFQPLAVFLDTNFIFGILDLHSNPLVAVSHELVAFIERYHLPFTLYYHQETLEEMKRTVAAIGSSLTARYWTTALSRAAMRNGQVSGLELRYHELNSQQPVDPEAFLTPYEHPETLLKGKGFVIYRESGGNTHSNEDHDTLTSRYREFIETRRRPKPAGAYDHDMILWSAARDKRKIGNSVLEAGAVLLTCDYHLYAFDQQVLRKPAQLGITALPNHFMQMLRPLVPATDDFDRRFVETFAIPEFRTVGSNYSATVSKVLSYLATFSSMSEETAVRILADELLIENLRGVPEDAPEFKASIENALAQDNEHLLEEIARWRAEAQRAEDGRTQAEQKAGSTIEELIGHQVALSNKLEQAQSQSAVEIQNLRSAFDQEQSKRKELEETLLKTSQEAERRTRLFASRWQVAFALLLALIGTYIILALPQLQNWAWLQNHQNRLGLYGCALGMLAASCWAIADPPRRKFALGTVGLSIMAVLIQIVQR